MKLTELEPEFCKLTSEGNGDSWRTDVGFADCDGVMFLCPKCWTANKGPIGTHVVICWKPHVPQTVSPGPGRWSHTGTGFSDLSLVAGSSSVHLQGGCGAHVHVRGGEVIDT